MLKRWAIIICLLLCVSSTSHAAAPANDLCSGAESIPGSGPFPNYSSIAPDVSGATNLGDPPSPSCVAVGATNSVWYRFQPALSGLYTLSVSDDTATTVP